MSFIYIEDEKSTLAEQEKFYSDFIKSLGFSSVIKTGNCNNVLKFFCTIELGIIFQKFLVFVYINNNEIKLEDICFMRSEMDRFTDKGIIITKAKISRSAKKDSRKKNKIPIDFITKDEIIKRVNL